MLNLLASFSFTGQGMHTTTLHSIYYWFFLIVLLKQPYYRWSKWPRQAVSCIVAHAIHGIAKLHLTYWKMALENVSGIFQDGKT